jgi:hypothetical protein
MPREKPVRLTIPPGEILVFASHPRSFDSRFYALQDEVDLNAKMLEFMRPRGEAFFFRGKVERAVFPR